MFSYLQFFYLTKILPHPHFPFFLPKVFILFYYETLWPRSCTPRWSLSSNISERFNKVTKQNKKQMSCPDLKLTLNKLLCFSISMNIMFQTQPVLKIKMRVKFLAQGNNGQPLMGFKLTADWWGVKCPGILIAPRLHRDILLDWIEVGYIFGGLFNSLHDAEMSSFKDTQW